MANRKGREGSRFRLRVLLRHTIGVACFVCLAGSVSGQVSRDSIRSVNEAVRIGTVQGTPWGRIVAAAASPLGPVVVSDDLGKRVVVLDADGGVQTVIDRVGQGPGEFLLPWHVGFLADSIWIVDGGQPRVLTYLVDGFATNTLTLFPQPQPPPLRLGAPRALMDGRRLVAEVTVSPLSPMAEGMAQDRMPVVLLDSLARVQATLAHRDVSEFSYAIARENRPWNGFAGRQPFTRPPPWAPLPDGDGIMVANFAGCGVECFQIAAIDMEGDTIWTLNHRFTPKVLDPHLVDEVMDSLVERALQSRGLALATRREARVAVQEAILVPEYLPPVSGILPTSDRAGYLVRESVRGREPEQLTFILDGDVQFHVALPPKTRPIAATAHSIWAVSVGDFGEHSLVRLDLR